MASLSSNTTGGIGLHAVTHNSGGTDVLAADAAAATASFRTLGAGAAQALPGNTAVPHVEAKASGTPNPSTVTWTVAFGVTPIVTCAAEGGVAACWVATRSTTNASVNENSGGTLVKLVIARDPT